MQQITKVNLKAIKKCDQIWNDMKPIPGGRQCGLCKKKITDFREKSLKEIAEIHVYSNEPVCGIYTEHQLRNEENPIPIKSISRWSSIKSSYLSFASFLLTLSVSAQDSTTVPKPKMEQNEPDFSKLENQTKQHLSASSYIISGIISDYSTNEVIPMANVVFKANQKILMGCSTNSQGEYTLDLGQSIDSISGSYLVEVSFIGYMSKVIAIKQTDLKKLKTNKISNLNLHIKLQEGGEISFGVIETKPKSWFAKSWDFIKSIFTKKDK